jgi:uncharacterized RDD family membrane protein YckC
MTEEVAAVEVTKADPVKRAIAFIIDAVIAYVPSFIPVVGGLIGAAYMLLRDALPIQALEYRSVGKKIMNLKVVVEATPNAKVDYAISAKRNWMFAMGPVIMVFMVVPILGWIVGILLGLATFVLGIIEIVKVFTDPAGKRIGDGIAGTKVLES